jgi:hypothetical protein
MPETRECPFCKEEIKAAAVRCKHCLSDLTKHGCGCGGRARIGRSGGGHDAEVSRGAGFEGGEVPRVRVFARRASGDADCNDIEIDDDGIWCFIGDADGLCFYQQC